MNTLHLIVSSPWWTHWVWGKGRFGVQIFCAVQTTHLHKHTHKPTFIEQPCPRAAKMAMIWSLCWVFSQSRERNRAHSAYLVSLTLKLQDLGPQRRLTSLEHLLLFQRTQVCFPTSTWGLTAVYDSNTRGSDVRFWPLWAPGLHVALKYTWRKHSYTWNK